MSDVIATKLRRVHREVIDLLDQDTDEVLLRDVDYGVAQAVQFYLLHPDVECGADDRHALAAAIRAKRAGR